MTRWGHRTTWGLCAVLTLGAAAFAQEKNPPAEPVKKADDLGGRLIRKAAGEGDEDLMAGVIRLMGDAARKVEVEFDPGTQTQELQKQIEEKLDEAVKLAASKQRSRKQSASPTDKDRRRMPSAKQRDAKTTQRSKPGESRESADESTSPVSGNDAASPGERSDLRDARRTWGNLPRREREEVIQGASEGFLEKYRAWIERYYKALQEREE